jgi:hypothetical protein
MVARLKLKGIDGRAPPDVNIILHAVNSASESHLRRLHSNRFELFVPGSESASPSCNGLGDTPKLRETPKAVEHQAGSAKIQWPS